MDDLIDQGDTVWEGEHYRAYVMSIRPSSVKMGVAQLLGEDDIWYPSHKSLQDGYVGFVNVWRPLFLPDKKSIEEAVEEAIEDAQKFERLHHKIEHQKNVVRKNVLNAVRAHEAAAES